MNYRGNFRMLNREIKTLNKLLHCVGPVIDSDGNIKPNTAWAKSEVVSAYNVYHSPAIYSGILHFINNQNQPQVTCTLCVNGFETKSVMMRNFRKDITFEFQYGEDTIVFGIEGYDETLYLYSVQFVSTEHETGKEYHETELYAARSAFEIEDWAKAEAKARTENSSEYDYRFRHFDCVTEIPVISNRMAVLNGIHTVDDYKVAVKPKY